VLWCVKRVEQGVVCLDALPQADVEISDLVAVGQSLQASGWTGAVIVNLDALETISSSFVAGLLVLRRLIEVSGGRLILCGLRPHVYTILERLSLHDLFVIKNREQDVLSPR
jgi:anti-anti-sigma regulatory factor